MGKISQKEMLLFASEFAQAVAEVNEELLEDVLLRFGKSVLYMENAIGITEKELAGCLEDADMNITEFRDDEECEGFMICEGDLYEKMYGYAATGVDIFGDGDEAKKLNKALWEYTEKYGMWFEWCDGAISLYAE